MMQLTTDQESNESAAPSPSAAPTRERRGIVVQKYGGSSVATIEKLQGVARKIVETRREGWDVVVVVSAMGKTTDDLVSKARALSQEPPHREMDMLLSSGERISMSLLSMAVQELGAPAVSLTGSQSGILTNDVHANARIIEVRPFRIQDELEKGRVVIVAGFQGASYRREVTTLGRGGSDTTAVALAASLDAEHCDIFSDVDGVYSADPRVCEDALRLDQLCYEEMQELARQGARVLNAQAVEFARRHDIAIYARSTFGGPNHTRVERVDDGPQERLRELNAHGVTGVTGRKDLLRVLCEGDACGDCAPEVLEALRDCDVLSSGVEPHRHRLDLVVATENVADPAAFALELERRFDDGGLQVVGGLGSVSAVGLGVGDKPAALLEALGALREDGIDVVTSFTSREALTCLVDVEKVDEAVKTLHALFLEGGDDEEVAA
ncbi:MAG TPA: aspartate kinase [Sandaracinaceae bacterium LLY-WYZ-13_1]|nr:aspartate kinase [Sandaracinaceae bacterium LLY-WYZ-13_1]